MNNRTPRNRRKDRYLGIDPHNKELISLQTHSRANKMAMLVWVRTILGTHKVEKYNSTKRCLESLQVLQTLISSWMITDSYKAFSWL